MGKWPRRPWWNGFNVLDRVLGQTNRRDMLVPRNTLVLVKLIEKKELRIGQITVPDFDDLYTEAEVLAVGQGSVGLGCSQTETSDLKVGQRVFIQYKRKVGGSIISRLEGIRYVEGGESFYLFEQTNILGIIAEPC